MTSPGKRFLPGHDAKLRVMLATIALSEHVDREARLRAKAELEKRGWPCALWPGKEYAEPES